MIKDLPWDTYVVLDFETSGLEPGLDSIIEVGLLFVTGNVDAKPLSWVVNPNYPNPFTIPQEVVEITGITSDAVGRGADPSVFYPSLIRLLGDTSIWGHNSSQFDKAFLEYECRRLCIIPPKEENWYDTAAIYKANKMNILDEIEYYTMFQQFADYVLSKKVKGLYYNLHHVCEDLGVYTGDIPKWHRAGADVLGTMRVIKKFRETLF